MTELERFDGIFANITDSAAGIDNLLDAFFGFLARRTDFFDTTITGNAELSSKIINTYHNKWREIAVTNKKQTAAKLVDTPKPRTHTVSTSHKQVEEIINDEVLPEIEDAIPASASTEIQQKSVTKTDCNTKEEQSGQDTPPVGNGGKTDKYTWTQTLSTVDVFIPLKSKVSSSRLCKVDMSATNLKVVVSNETIVDGKLHDKIKPSDCLWTLEDNQIIHIILEKQEAMKWWSCVLKGDPEIDTKKVQPENSKLSDLDPELRQTIEKMMFDQNQKAKGLPTSDQLKQAEVLEQFKKQHPEMDFSQAKINYGNSSFSGQFAS